MPQYGRVYCRPIPNGLQGGLSSFFPKPLYEPFNSQFNWRLRVVVKEATRFCDVCVGLCHVTRLQRLTIDDGVRIKLAFKQRNQFTQFYRARLAEVDNFILRNVVVNCGTNSGEDVINIGVVAARCAVTENWNWLPLANELRKLVNCEIRTLSCTVHRKEPQADATHFVKM